EKDIDVRNLEYDENGQLVLEPKGLPVLNPAGKPEVKDGDPVLDGRLVGRPKLSKDKLGVNRSYTSYLEELARILEETNIVLGSGKNSPTPALAAAVVGLLPTPNQGPMLAVSGFVPDRRNIQEWLAREAALTRRVTGVRDENKIVVPGYYDLLEEQAA